jgi:hypothetical protein
MVFTRVCASERLFCLYSDLHQAARMSWLVFSFTHLASESRIWVLTTPDTVMRLESLQSRKHEWVRMPMSLVFMSG